MWGKSFLAVTAAVSVIALTAGSSSAGAGSVVINSPTTGTHHVTAFPSAQTVSVTFAHADGGKGSLCDLHWTMSVTGPGPEATVVWQDSGQFAFDESGGKKTCPAGADETITRQVVIPQRGTYTVSASLADHGHTGSDSETPTFEVIVSDEVRYAYPAAPAVANKLLKQAGVPGKMRGECIRAVAVHMGPRATFNGIPKRDVSNYRAAVDTFLHGNCPVYTS